MQQVVVQCGVVLLGIIGLKAELRPHLTHLRILGNHDHGLPPLGLLLFRGFVVENGLFIVTFEKLLVLYLVYIGANGGLVVLDYCL